MNKNLIIFGITVLFICVGLSGCNEKESANNKLDDSDITPKILSFGVSPSIIESGRDASLIWIVENSTTITIDNNIGSVSLQGTRVIFPSETTIYTLTAINGNNIVNASTQIVVLTESNTDKLIGTWRLVYESRDGHYADLYRFYSDRTAEGDVLNIQDEVIVTFLWDFWEFRDGKFYLDSDSYDYEFIDDDYLELKYDESYDPRVGRLFKES